MSKKEVTAQELLDLINSSIPSIAGFIHGMNIKSVRSRDGKLILNGECFLDNNGNPTHQTEKAREFYQEIAASFSNEFNLK